MRIAVAGAGLIGRRHVELVQANPACELVGLADPAPSTAEFAQATGAALYHSLAEMLSKARPDGVILATPNHVHVEQAMLCLKVGVPALIEKPVAASVDEGEQLLAAVEASGVPMLVGHHRAHSPILARAREVIASGQLGRIVSVMGSAQFYKPQDYFAAGPWRAKTGGGPVLINLVHEIDNLRRLCGGIVAVQAMASHALRGFEVEDSVAINFRFASGALGVFLLSDTAASPKSWEQTSQENAAYPHYADVDCYEITGTLGSLSVPTMRIKFHDGAGTASWWKPFAETVLPLERQDPLACQLNHFCDVIAGRAKPLVSVRDGLQNLRVIEAIKRAAETGQAVEI